jgi:hypothetical protein
MANGMLQCCLREPRSRPADREVFAQVMSRLSDLRRKRQERQREPAKSETTGA